ncbi:MAG: c-type cytochrome [Pseudomonadota bacterium]
MRHLLPLLLIAAPLAAAAQTEALVDYVVENGSTIPDPLAEWEGGVEAGAALHQSAGCADCHAAPGFEDAPAIGPDLSGVADRLTEGETRLMVVNPRIVLPETDMPAYYAVGQIGEVPDDLVGRTRLTPLEVEQIVAWLMSLSD